MRLKRWESPRREGRNDKGKGGSARKRQIKKQRQMLRQKLKEANKQNKQNNQNDNKNREDFFFPVFLLVLRINLHICTYTNIKCVMDMSEKHTSKIK
ncbi:hypothetical protein CLI64_13370 [Nostoc sp. CENA543]|uniref:hypothetical protein n=1 Tax=Nostoc sp. CENA543 TaxID=1869241 RepID=UPI000CA23199|nr:hypothetical protein [Nostoc sp. CENA543]AUT01311.1 hypothetical protein CLI64_13370 [Nostoc sp. CENA543]